MIHEAVRNQVVPTCERSSLKEMAAVADDREGDTIFAIDKVSEDIIVEYFDREVASIAPIVLIAEGLSGGKIVLPSGAREHDAVWRVIVDPIDGTRELMYQKRSAWILTGVAPNRGENTALRDIDFAIQSEIPLAKQHLSDTIWAFKGRGVNAERHDRLTGRSSKLDLLPSTAATIEHGFAMISRFFPGARDVLAAIDEEIVLATLGKPKTGKAQCFEDQYLSTGGQLYELMAGHDRFVADLRPLMAGAMRERGLELSICCHPYDVCTELLARELGVIVVDENGDQLDTPLSLDHDVTWIGYANNDIRRQVEPILKNALRKRGMIK